MCRDGSANPNWKGGISSIKRAEDILSLGDWVKDEVERWFLSHLVMVDRGCWEWDGGVFKSNGRAKMTLGTHLLASRVSYVLYKGLPGDLCVLHTCDNVLCVNPDHLWLGTNADNSADMIAKHRNMDQTGSLNNHAKLNEGVVSIIKQRLLLGERQNKLAREYAVSNQTINNIAHNKTWSHV